MNAMNVEMIEGLPFYATTTGIGVAIVVVVLGTFLAISFLYLFGGMIGVFLEKEVKYSVKFKSKLLVRSLIILVLSVSSLFYGLNSLAANNETDYVKVDEAGYAERVSLETLISPDGTINGQGGNFYKKDDLLIDPAYCEITYTAVDDDTAKVEANCYVESTDDRELVTF